jgi:hypothetical protein
MALQLRRGTNAERLAMTPLIGELIYVTDYELVTISVTAIDAGTDTLTSVAHGLTVNQQIKFQDANLNGLTLNQVYFVKAVPSSDTFTLSLTLGGGIVDITGTFTIPLIFAKTPTNAAGVPLGTNSTPLWVGDGVTVGGIVAASLNLDDLLDVDITSLAEGNSFYYDATTGFWRNTAIITVDDVTNNVTLLGGLTVDTKTLKVNATTNKVGINNASPSYELHIGDNTYGFTQFGITTTERTAILTIDDSNDLLSLSYGTTPGATGRLTFDGATGNQWFNTGNLGVNTTTPAYTLDVNGTANIETSLTVPSITTLTGDDLNITAFSGRDVTISTTAATDPVTVVRNTTATGSGGVPVRTLTLRLDSTGTPVVGFGSQLEFETETTPGTTVQTGYINNQSTGDNAGVLDEFKMSFGVMSAGTTTTRMELDNLGNLQIDGDLAVNGGDITTTQTTGNLFNTTATTVNIGGAATTMSIGNAAGTVTIPGNLTINGTTTNINTTNLLVEDKNITIGDVATPSDVTAAGGGITLLGATNKTITWNNAADGWEFNQPIKVTGDIVTSGDLAVNGGDITTTQAIGNLFNTTATTVNIGDGATSQVNIGNYTSGTVNIKSQSLLQNDLSPGISTTFNLFNTITTDLNIGGAATSVDIGSTVSGTTTIGYDLLVNNNVDADQYTVDNLSTYNTQTTNTSLAGTPVSISATTRVSQKSIIKIIDNVTGEVHMVEALAFRSGTAGFLTTYAEMYSSVALATFTVTGTGGFTTILANPISSNSTTFTVARISLD